MVKRPVSAPQVDSGVLVPGLVWLALATVDVGSTLNIAVELPWMTAVWGFAFQV